VQQECNILGMPMKGQKRDSWPRVVTEGRTSIRIYRRRTPSGNWGFLVANYAGGKRRLDSYPTETDAVREAGRLARMLSEREVVAAEMRNEDAAAYAAAIQSLRPFSVELPTVASTVAECLKLVGNLPGILGACQEHANRQPINFPVVTVADAVKACLDAKRTGGASSRYLADLRYRLGRFQEAFHVNVSAVRGNQIQAWFDAEEFSPQSRINFRRVLHLWGQFCIRKGWLPKGWDELERLERVKARAASLTIFSPDELARLLSAADSDYLPTLAIQAFAGLRSAEVERLDWKEVRLAEGPEGFVEITAAKAKTRARRLVPACDALRQWLAPYARASGLVWAGGKTTMTKAQAITAARAGVPWRKNALRHSWISARVADTQDVAKTALEAGNSPSVVFSHYRQVITPAEAARWFSVMPSLPANVATMKAA